MGRQPVSAKVAFYGGLQPQGVIGQEQFAQHEAERYWNDNDAHAGIIEEAISEAIEVIRENLRERVRVYGAEQARDAVTDYLSNGYFDVAVIGGELCVAFDASNEGAELRPWVRLGDLLEAAAKQAEKQRDERFLMAVAALQERLPAFEAAVREEVSRRPGAQRRAARQEAMQQGLAYAEARPARGAPVPGAFPSVRRRRTPTMEVGAD